MLIDKHPQELREQPILKQELHQFPILQTPIQQLFLHHERKRQQEKQDEFQSGAQWLSEWCQEEGAKRQRAQVLA